MSELVRHRDEIPNPGSVEGILSVVRKALAKPFVQSILVSETGIVVDWMKSPEDNLFTEVKGRTPLEVLDEIDLVEFNAEVSPLEAMFSAQMLLSDKGMKGSHIFCSSVGALKEWIGLGPFFSIPKDSINGVYMFGGYTVIETNHVPEHSIVVAGGKVVDLELNSVLMGVRMSIGEK